MKTILRKVYVMIQSIINASLMRNAKKSGITTLNKIKLFLIHTFYSNYQPMELGKWSNTKI